MGAGWGSPNQDVSSTSWLGRNMTIHLFFPTPPTLRVPSADVPKESAGFRPRPPRRP
ncbi:hypothetical protein ACFPRL_12570 [Pseudoclavibacter helvolus]